jgi:hypothetical protein
VVSRTIVTSQPEVACAVCARRLLRGEHSEIFLAGGRRCNVCELCAPRAIHEGWKREVEHDPLSHAPLRPRRGRSLIGRLLKAPGPADGAGDARFLPGERDHGGAEPYDFLGGAPDGGRSSGRSAASPARRATPAPAPGREALELAIDIFNRGEYPRRLAGVARSLGVPEVSIHQADPRSSVVGIVVAWELCWYRYAVDLEGEAEARTLAQGTALEELAPEERVANGVIDERGALSLSL